MATRVSSNKVDQIYRLHSEGLNDEAIGRRLGITGPCVAKYRRKVGIPLNYPRLNAEQLATMHALKTVGTPYVEIANDLQIAISSVHRHLQKAGLTRKTPKSPAQSPIIIDEAHFRCRQCGEIKPSAHWPKRGLGSYFTSLCAACAGRNYRGGLTDTKQIYERFTKLKCKCKRLGIKLGITRDDLVALWNQQNGRCFYTDEPLVFTGPRHSPNLFSIDKIEPANGYVFGNVVIASMRANTLKRDMTLAEMRRFVPEWYKRVSALKRRNCRLQIVDSPMQQLQISFSNSGGA